MKENKENKKKLKFKDVLPWLLLVLVLGLFGLIYVMNQKPMITQAGTVIEKPITTVQTEAQLLAYATENDSLRKLLEKGDKPKVITRVVTQVKFDTLRIPFEKVVYKTKVIRDTVTKQDVVVEFAQKDFAYKDSTLTLTGSVTDENVTINTFRLDNKIDLLTVERKPKGLFKFLKRSKKTVIAVSSDPRVVLTGVTQVELEVPQKNNFGAGFWTGLGVGVAGFGAIQLIK
jgi:hypothetical protein